MIKATSLIGCNGGTRHITSLTAVDTPNRAKGSKSGRSPRASQEGTLVLLGTACAPHPPCIMHVPRSLQKCHIARGSPFQIHAIAPNQHTHEHTHTKNQPAHAIARPAAASGTRSGISK